MFCFATTPLTCRISKIVMRTSLPFKSNVSQKEVHRKALADRASATEKKWGNERWCEKYISAHSPARCERMIKNRKTITLGLSLAYGFQQQQKISNKEQKSKRKREKHPTSGYSQTFCNLLPREELVMWRGKMTARGITGAQRLVQCWIRESSNVQPGHFRVKFNRLQISSIPFDSKFNSNQPWARGTFRIYDGGEDFKDMQKSEMHNSKRKQPFRKHIIQHRKTRRCVLPPVRTVSLGVW